MSLQEGMFILGYIVLFGAFLVCMQIWLINDKVKRMQEEVRELQKARWDHERKLSDQLLETRRELWGKQSELRTELQKQIIEERAATEKLAEKLRSEFRPETTKSMAAELLKRMQEDWMKQLDNRLSRLEKHDHEIRMKDLEEINRGLDEMDSQHRASVNQKMKQIERNLRIARGQEPDEEQPPSEEVKN
jgi:hypothetical protein